METTSGLSPGRTFQNSTQIREQKLKFRRKSRQSREKRILFASRSEHAEDGSREQKFTSPFDT
jgi:hypothetical protein